ncbi:MAG TPA: response regulator transcription factor [Acidobacteriaceae bacterium]|jgi:DNA-binding NarL/FixJ family response regulator|nr:response regulator transcription factor [Acidobacteriaceae bacterium]
MTQNNGHNSTPLPPQAPQASPEVRVILADSQAIYRVGMRKVFGPESGILVAAEADNLQVLQDVVQRVPADVLLLEGAMITGTANAVPAIVRLAPDLKVIVQAASTDESGTVDLYRRGVRGIIPRSISPELLVKCVRKIAAGETWIDNQSVTWVIEAYRSQAGNTANPRNQPRLNQKEMLIIAGITQGKRNKEIAYQLGTTEQVVKNYLRKIYDKLGVSDRLELALYCLHHQLHKNAAESDTRPLEVSAQPQ